MTRIIRRLRKYLKGGSTEYGIIVPTQIANLLRLEEAHYYEIEPNLDEQEVVVTFIYEK